MYVDVGEGQIQWFVEGFDVYQQDVQQCGIVQYVQYGDVFVGSYWLQGRRSGVYGVFVRQVCYYVVGLYVMDGCVVFQKCNGLLKWVVVFIMIVL